MSRPAARDRLPSRDRQRRFQLTDLYPADASSMADEKQPGLAELLNSGLEAEIVEVDRAGYQGRRWLHLPNHRTLRMVLAARGAPAPPPPVASC